MSDLIETEPIEEVKEGIQKLGRTMLGPSTTLPTLQRRKRTEKIGKKLKKN